MADGYRVYRALYTFQGRTANELSFNEGDYLYAESAQPDPDGWLRGHTRNGSVGLFHQTYAKEEQQQPPPLPPLPPRGPPRGRRVDSFDSAAPYVHATGREPPQLQQRASFDSEYVTVQRNSHSRYSNAPSPTTMPIPSPTTPPSSNIDAVPWYWKTITSDEAREMLESEPDGAFLVRDNSRTPGNYTLSVKKDGITRRVQIHHRNGMYGFSEPLPFRSVVELVDFYRHRSLAEHNASLDISLCFAKERPQPRTSLNELEPINQQEVEELMQDLRQCTDECDRLNKEYHRKVDNLSRLGDDLTNMNRRAATYRIVVNTLDEQESTLQNNRVHVMSDLMHELVMNLRLISERKRSAMEALATIESQMRTLEFDRDGLTTETEELKLRVMEKTDLKAQIMMDLGDYRVTPDIIKRRLFALRKADKDIQMEDRMMKQRRASYVPPPEEEEETTQLEDVYYDIYGTTQEILRDEEDADWLIEMDREQSNRCLSSCSDGTFLVRPRPNASPSDRHQYTLVISFQGQVNHIKVLCEDGWFGFTEGSCSFSTLRDLVRHYQTTSLHQHNKKLTITLETPYNRYARGGSGGGGGDVASPGGGSVGGSGASAGVYY
ncbi:phosphatidylinositol 3-kinase regulatory subunit gamma-like [Oscarella lobularis]|uniref:phosphatidylinositol 3-kinase regulatory subunit gamma-like n=1 Tax=Oscarella lobularis TaxID=121494 RepID=UPI003313DBDB